MAGLGRSNSLSINTNAVNNSFAQQNNQQPSTAGGLFGGSLFGNNAQKPATTSAGTSLFGQPATAGAPASTSLFGQPATTAANTGGGLFGSTTTTSQPAQGGSLFGTATAQPAQSGGLFGTATTQPAAQSGGLFGTATQNNGTSSLFGGNTANTQPAQGGGLFGGGASTTNNTTGSLFGNQNKPAAGGSLFGGSLFGAGNSTAQPAAGGLFGQTTLGNNNAASQNVQQQQQTPSLLSASRYTLGQPAPFTGRLTMGQGNEQQTTSTPAVKLDWDNVKPVTRYADLVESAKSSLDKIDEMIRAQEHFCKQIEAILPSHSNDLSSLQPDIDLIKEKCITAEQALITDAQDIQQLKLITKKDHEDILRCERIGENLRLPAQYHYAPAASGYGNVRKTSSKTGESSLDEQFDVNLVNNYFTPMAAEMQSLLSAYSSNLQEIESHLSTIEASATAQAQKIAGQRSGSNGNDSVRQLADTLHGFEATILATAAKVGAAREGVTKLSLSGNPY